MRLDLGEDMDLTPLLDRVGSDEAEPLTFVQRMLYFAEEITMNDFISGFSAAIS